ncbi:MAG: MATE family efflux transporter [Phascolarctobacterium sp.]|nr:MATE family efflux transporter [Phascolarctobacterium sp.]
MVSALGEEAMSGVSLINILEYFMYTVMSAICSGGGIVISQYIGAKNNLLAKKTANQLLSLAMVIAFILSTLGLIYHKGFLHLLYGNVDTGVMQAADTYFLIAVCSIPCIAIHQACSAMFRSMNETKIPLYTVIVLNITNIIGNYMAVYVLHAGVYGVALATVLARVVGNALMLICSLQTKYVLHINLPELLTFDSFLTRKILSVSIPNSIENGLFAAGKVIMTSIVALFGTTQTAANAVSNTYQISAIFVVNAINMAMLTVVGQCVGANEYEQAKYYVKKLLKLSFWSTAALSVLVIMALPLTLDFYHISAETQRLVIILVILHNVAATILQPLCFNLPNAIRAAGDVGFTMRAGIGSMLIFRLGVAYIAGILLNYQILGVWFAMVADWFVRSLLFTYRWKSGVWKNYRIV